MTIDDFHNGNLPMPKMFRVVSVVFNVMSDFGEYYDTTTRRVRRVRHTDSWHWQIARGRNNKKEWDYYLESDREAINDINYEYGLMK